MALMGRLLDEGAIAPRATQAPKMGKWALGAMAPSSSRRPISAIAPHPECVRALAPHAK